jgi:antirestriction protein ArdC
MAPIVRQVEEQERLLDDLMQQVQGLPDEYFSKDEAQDLVRRLEELEHRLSDNLAANINDKAQLNSQIQAIVSDIQMLKDNIGSLKKPGWAKALMVRAAEWIKVPANRQLLRSGAEVAKELLLEAGKHSTTSGN